MDKGEQVSAGPPNWVSGPLGWAPRKLTELKTFFVEVRSELKKVTWPTRETVIRLTLLVIAVSVAVGLYIAVLDRLFNSLLDAVLP